MTVQLSIHKVLFINNIISMNFLLNFRQLYFNAKGHVHQAGKLKMYWKEFMHQCVEIGIGSLGNCCHHFSFYGCGKCCSNCLSVTSPFIPKSTIAQIVRDTVILEFAPTLVCIVLAGVVGSKIASELGNMRVSEQIDALEIMGINTKSYLVMPKIVAALITIPLLVVIAMVWVFGAEGLQAVCQAFFQLILMIRDCCRILFLIMYGLHWLRHILLHLL